MNPICNCDIEVESVIHFFLPCPSCSNERCTLLKSLNEIDYYKLLDSTHTFLTQTLLFGNSSFTTNDNTKIINFNPLSANLTKWSNTLKQFVCKLPTNYLSESDHFVGLALKELNIDFVLATKRFDGRLL